MRLLLDTHTFLWLDGNPEQVSPTALAACEDSTNQLYLMGAGLFVGDLVHAATPSQGAQRQ